MTDFALDPILLGHNPFFGIDHRSQSAGNEKAQRFEDSRRILEMLHFCHDLGIRGMMMSTHPRAAALCEEMGRDSRLAQWRIYPLVPYLQRYVREANTKGLVNTVLESLTRGNPLQTFSWILQGGKSLLTKDVRHILTQLIDQELALFKGRPLGAVFLHDGLTDLALGLGIESVLEVFDDHVRKKVGAPAGFVTKNLPLLRHRLEGRGWKQPLVMASFNSKGFSMNPSAAACQEALKKPGIDFVAMNTLASGAIPPQEAYPFLAQFPCVRSVVVGFSRKDHAQQTVEAIRKTLFFPRTAPDFSLQPSG